MLVSACARVCKSSSCVHVSNGLSAASQTFFPVFVVDTLPVDGSVGHEMLIIVLFVDDNMYLGMIPQYITILVVVVPLRSATAR